LVDKKQVPVLKEITIVCESIYTVGKQAAELKLSTMGKRIL